VPTDVSDEAAVNALAAAAVDRFGAVHVVCNNAGVGSDADPWFGPLSAWRWVLGVNLWGVIHGIRAFLPVLAAQGEGHIVNTASIAGLAPGAGPIYDATKHAVVAISEDLYRAMNVAMLPIGVSVLCPGWVRTSILQADRNWPQSLGEVPPRAGDRRSNRFARSARGRRGDGACRGGRPGRGRHRRQPVLGIHRPSFHPAGARPVAAHRRRPQSTDRGRRS
jgi:NAD(P)-dependent dehydrogenase (short-subunit alcohol dehydrogenase family)